MLTLNEEGQIDLTKIGFYLHSDMMTNVNLRFTNDNCYKGLFNLTDSIKNGKAEGLKEYGPWKTIYEGLSQLSPELRKSWLDFDHYYSDDAFDDALKIIFNNNPNLIFDIGGNTGKWAIASCNNSSDVEVKIVDLPGQVELAKKNIENTTTFKDRISYHPIDILKPETEIPGGADVYWMSQFLDCFGTDEILSILQRVYAAIDEHAFVYILEPFWNNQRFPASRFCLVGTSMYFTCIANGNSKMYHTDEMEQMTVDTGFELVDSFELIGDSYHTLLKLRKKM